MVSKDFKDFFNSVLSEIDDEGDSVSKLKIIISQFEIDKLCLFIVSEDDNNRYCRGHYGICDLTDENNSISICKYFEIVRFLKSKLNIDVIFEWDWYLNGGSPLILRERSCDYITTSLIIKGFE